MYDKGVTSDKLQVTSGNILDQWIIARLEQTHAEVTKQLDLFNTVRSGKCIVDFLNDLSTWYVRRSRDRIKGGDAAAKEALSTLGFVLAETSKLLAPFCPFLAEFVYKDVTGEESVHLTDWSVMDAANEEVIAKMEIVREVVTAGLGIRKEKSLGVRQPLAAMAFELQDAKTELPSEYHQLILEEMNVKTVEKSLVDKDTRPEGVAAAVGVKAVKNVYLDLNLNDELKLEGLARELERQVQDLRKKSGLKVGDLVDLYYNTQDAHLEEILLSNLDRKKTFVSQISKSLEVEVDFEIQAQVNGKAVWLGMIKI